MAGLKFIQITFSGFKPEDTDILIGLLSGFNHTGMLEENASLKVYFKGPEYPEKEMVTIANRLSCLIESKFVEERNWNQEWESSYAPVRVDDFCCVRTDFHKPPENVKYDLLINPKMSFGTGHHATTYLMIKRLATLDLKGKRVFDFGCGTGVLAILAEKMGASSVLATDIDEWALGNSRDNIKQNQCSHIRVSNEEPASLVDRFDYILANINRNILIENMPYFRALLTTGGKLLLSGILYDSDREIIISVAEELGLHYVEEEVKEKWLAMLFQKGSNED